MAKKQDLAKSFSSGSRKSKPILSEEEINKIAEEREAEKKMAKIIKEPTSEPIPTPVLQEKPAKPTKKQTRYKDEELVKTSIDMPAGLYEDMKIYLIRQKKSMREYLLNLIEKDLNKKLK